MRKFRRRAGTDRGQPRRTPPLDDGRAVAPPECITMCWLLQPATTRPVAPSEVTVHAGHVEIRCAPDGPDRADARTADRWDAAVPAAQQDLRRLAQIDVWGTDVDLLFVDSDSSLALTTLRLVGQEALEQFLRSVLTAYRAYVGSPFPPTWLLRHPPRVPED